MYEQDIYTLRDLPMERMFSSKVDRREDGIYAFITIPALIHCSDKMMNDLQDFDEYAQFSDFDDEIDVPPASEKLLLNYLTPILKETDIDHAKPVHVTHLRLGKIDPDIVRDFAPAMKEKTMCKCNKLIAEFEDDPLSNILQSMSMYHTPDGLKVYDRIHRVIELASGKFMINSPGLFVDGTKDEKNLKAHSYADPNEIANALQHTDEFCAFRLVFEYRLVKPPKKIKKEVNENSGKEQIMRKFVADIRHMEATLNKVADALQDEDLKALPADQIFCKDDD